MPQGRNVTGTPKAMLGIATSGHKTPRRTLLVYHNHQDNGKDEHQCHFERDHSQTVVWSATNTPNSTVTGRRTLHDDDSAQRAWKLKPKLQSTLTKSQRKSTKGRSEVFLASADHKKVTWKNMGVAAVLQQLSSCHKKLPLFDT